MGVGVRVSEGKWCVGDLYSGRRWKKRDGVEENERGCVLRNLCMFEWMDRGEEERGLRFLVDVRMCSVRLERRAHTGTSCLGQCVGFRPCITSRLQLPC